MGIVSAQAPLVLKDQRLSIDLKKLQKVIGSGGGKPVLYDGGGGLGEAFKTISVAGQSDLNAVGYVAETLTFQAGNNIAITTDPATNSVSIAAITSSDFHYRSGKPVGGVTGSRWMDSDTGIEYVYVPAGSAGEYVWVQPQMPNMTVSILATASVTTSTYQATTDDYYIGVNYSGPVTITLPASPETGRQIVVKDESGHAGDGIGRAITVVGYGVHLIDNQSSATINISNGALQFIYRGGWRIV
jgi:hypothetical protein